MNIAYLFDLDGLLINSEELYLAANKVYFARFGFEFTEELHRQGTGKRFAEWIKTVTDINLDGDTILAERNMVYFDLAKTRLRLMPGAREVLAHAAARGRTALVTSSNSDYVWFVFDHTGIGGYFDVVVAGDQVMHAKPDPEGYQMAADLLNVDPSRCVVFEDAPSGVEAGKNADMKVVAVPSPYVRGAPEFATVDLLLDSLTEYITAEPTLRLTEDHADAVDGRAR